jgi:hypothetical protein
VLVIGSFMLPIPLAKLMFYCRNLSDRHQLVQQMQMIGGGALGPQASNAVRHVAAQNGVWSLGNFGGVPPKSAMTYYPETQGTTPDATTSQGPADAPISATVQEHDYRFIFNSSPVGMVSENRILSSFGLSCFLFVLLVFNRLLLQWAEHSSTVTNCFASCPTTTSKKYAR